MEAAAMPPGRGQVAAASIAGDMIGGGLAGLAGYQDPMEQKARLIQEAQQEVQQSGVDIFADPGSYYKAAAEALSKRGLEAEAMQAYQLFREEQYNAAQIGIEREKAVTGRISAEASMLKAQADAAAQDTASASDFITLAPPGTTEKGTGREQTFNMKDPQQAAIAKRLLDEEKYVDTSKLPTPKKESGLTELALAVQGQTAALRDIAAGKEYAKEGAQADINRRTKVYADATISASLLRDINNIESALDLGGTTFGSAAEVRRGLASVFQTFMPQLAEDVNRALGIDLVSYDAVQRSSKTILSELASKYSGGNRMTAAALQTLADAGPAVFLTNEGLKSVTSLFRKSSRYSMDRANYLASLEESSGGNPVAVDRLITRWEIDNANNPDYFMTNKELQDIKNLERKNKVIRDLQKNAVELTPIRNSKGQMGVNLQEIAKYPDGTVFYYNGEFYKKTQGVPKRVNF